MTNDKTPPNTIYIAFGNTLYEGTKGTQSIRHWTSDAEQARMFEQETGAKAHEYRLAAPAAVAVPSGWVAVTSDRSYDQRAKALIAFNTAEKNGKDRDDALQAAWDAMLAAAPQPPVATQEPVAWRLRNTAFRSEVYEYFKTKFLAECRQKQFNASVDDGGLHDLTPLYTLPAPQQAPAGQGDVQWMPASEPPPESEGEVLVRMADGRCEIAWATYWHGSSDEFAQWTFRDPDEYEHPVAWMRIPRASARAKEGGAALAASPQPPVAAPVSEQAAAPSAPKCTACGAQLQRVTQGPNSYLSADQFDADKLGDWFCDCCPKGPNKGSREHRYFWNRELADPATQPAPVAQGDALPTIKGVSIGGGYVIVTPAGWGDDKAWAVRDAILRIFPVNSAYMPKPSEDAARAQAKEGGE